MDPFGFDNDNSNINFHDPFNFNNDNFNNPYAGIVAPLPPAAPAVPVSLSRPQTILPNTIFGNLPSKLTVSNLHTILRAFGQNGISRLRRQTLLDRVQALETSATAFERQSLKHLLKHGGTVSMSYGLRHSLANFYQITRASIAAGIQDPGSPGSAHNHED